MTKFDALFAGAPRDHWVDLLSRHDLMAARVQDYTELVQDPQVLANQYIVELEHPEHGPLKIVNHPVRFSAAPGVGVRGFAPEFGQHTEEVLLEAGYTWEEIEALKARGAVGPCD